MEKELVSVKVKKPTYFKLMELKLNFAKHGKIMSMDAIIRKLIEEYEKKYV